MNANIYQSHNYGIVGTESVLDSVLLTRRYEYEC